MFAINTEDCTDNVLIALNLTNLFNDIDKRAERQVTDDIESRDFRSYVKHLLHKAQDKSSDKLYALNS